MQRRSAESLAFATRAGVRGVSTGRREGISRWRCGPIQRAIRQAAADVFESCGRVARKTHMPTRKGILEFFGNQVLINAVAWTAGVIAAGLVKSFFEVKGFRNLWGLIAPRGRALVSADDYQMIMTLMSYSAGLLMLILVRHLILRLITEFRALRLERARWREGSTRTHLLHDLPADRDAGRPILESGLSPNPTDSLCRGCAAFGRAHSQTF